MVDAPLETIAFVVLALLVIALLVAGMLLGLIACSPAKTAEKKLQAAGPLPPPGAPK